MEVKWRRRKREKIAAAEVADVIVWTATGDKPVIRILFKILIGGRKQLVKSVSVCCEQF